MAINKGFIQCSERHCSEVAEVLQASGKRSTLYTKCPACGTNQGHGEARQKYLADNLKATRDEVQAIPEKVVVSDTKEQAHIPSNNAASEVLDDTAAKPKAIPENKPKDIPTAPPMLLGVGVLLATMITAIFATRKPSNKPKGQTA